MVAKVNRNMKRLKDLRTVVTHRSARGAQASPGGVQRQFTSPHGLLTGLGLACVLALAGCGGAQDAKVGQTGYVKGFYGAVAADEPRAALIGRDILTAGGTAGDAAAAIYFALSVTMPSSASLGGGGVCVVFERDKKRVEMLDFVARPPAVIPAGASRPSAVPGNVRGLYAIHARLGKLPWGQAVGPAEALARIGNPMSRAFASDLAQVADPLVEDPEARRIFMRKSGMVAKEGDILEQLDLAGTLSLIRTQGPGAFYGGTFARSFAEAAVRVGGSLDVEDLRGYQPVWRPTVQVKIGRHAVHFAAPPASAGAVAAQMTAMIDARGFKGDDGDKAHLLAEVAQRAFVERGRWLAADGSVADDVRDLVAAKRIEASLAGIDGARHARTQTLAPGLHPRPETPAATSYVVVDRLGNAVACAHTLNNLFGTGRIAPGTGILLAALPGHYGRGPMSLGPMLMVNPHTNEAYFAGAATGGVTAPTALAQVFARAAIDDQPLGAAMAAPRVHHGGMPDALYHEPNLSPGALDALRRRGHELAASQALGKVNAIYCPEGLPSTPDLCRVAADPRGYGLASGANR